MVSSQDVKQCPWAIVSLRLRVAAPRQLQQRSYGIRLHDGRLVFGVLSSEEIQRVCRFDLCLWAAVAHQRHERLDRTLTGDDHLVGWADDEVAQRGSRVLLCHRAAAAYQRHERLNRTRSGYGHAVGSYRSEVAQRGSRLLLRAHTTDTQ
eukprot:scaffold63585_cov58-Phaeocystis_antarctica.AAC.2